jgi:NO-binding membrane sensor protein with MHYT domain
MLTPTMLMLMMASSLGGIAIWCMHFVGMAAMTLRDPDGNVMTIRYRIDLTIGSLVIVIGECARVENSERAAKVI